MSTELRVVLLGKTGVGKSSTGNTILGDNKFTVAHGLLSGTENCQWAFKNRGTINIQVTDTPGLCDTHRTQNDVLNEVGKSVAVTGAGPHVVLIVINCGARFTDEEFQAYCTLKELFGEGIKDYVIVVFTHIDALGATPEIQKEVLASQIRQPGKLRDVLQEVSNRYFGVNNIATSVERETQAENLVCIMQDLVNKNNPKYFRSEFSDEVDTLRRQLLDEKMSRGSCDRSQAERELNDDIVRERVDPVFFDTLLDIVSKKILPALKKVIPVMVAALGVAKDLYPLLKDAKQCSLM